MGRAESRGGVKMETAYLNNNKKKLNEQNT